MPVPFHLSIPPRSNPFFCGVLSHFLQSENVPPAFNTANDDILALGKGTFTSKNVASPTIVVSLFRWLRLAPVGFLLPQKRCLPAVFDSDDLALKTSGSISSLCLSHSFFVLMSVRLFISLSVGLTVFLRSCVR